MGNDQSSRAVPETGVDSGVASARLRPEPIDVAAWRQAMEGVTPEGWTVRVGQDGSLRLCIAGEPESGPVSLRNAQWVARCTVPAVLPLLDALAAKDRELAEADAEIVSSHCLIAEERQMRFAAERALDEAMAALREKEELRAARRRYATPIREEDILHVAMERFFAAPGGNEEGIKAVLEWVRPVFFDMALEQSDD